jgi:hypothetical protein
MSGPAPFAGIRDTDPDTSLKVEVSESKCEKRAGHFEFFSDRHPKRPRTKLVFQVCETKRVDEDTQEGAAKQEGKRDMTKNHL